MLSETLYQIKSLRVRLDRFGFQMNEFNIQFYQKIWGQAIVACESIVEDGLKVEEMYFIGIFSMKGFKLLILNSYLKSTVIKLSNSMSKSYVNF